MTVRRRDFLGLLAGAAALPVMPRSARAQSWPVRPVRWIVPWLPGGAADISARLIGQWLSERLGQPFVIENRAGAGGNIGTEAVARSAPDGYTLLLAGSFNAINATLYGRLSFNFIQDIAPVAGIMRNPLVMEVHPSVPASSVSELIAYAKAHPAKLNMGSAGNGSPQHVAGELFKMMAGIDMVHVPYRGLAPMLTDLLGGQVQVTFDPLLSSLEHIRAGRLRALAVTTATRCDALPDIPTVAELVPGYETSGWTGVGVPRGTPAEIIDRLNREINAGLAEPAIKARLAGLGGTMLAGSPAELATFIAEETRKFAKVIKIAGITPE